MEHYNNFGGDSGIVAYEIGVDSIMVQFSDGSIYLYNYQSTGSESIDHMKKLAIAGEGFHSYIGRVVKKRYASKIR